MLLETLLVVFSMIAMGSLFFLIYITWTLNDRLQDNDDVINKLQGEIDMLRKERTLRQSILEIEKKSNRDKDQTIKDLEEIAELDSTRLVRYTNIIDKRNQEIDTIKKKLFQALR